MIKKLIQNITEGSTYSGVEITNTENGNDYYFLELKKTKSELIVSKSLILKSLDRLKPLLKKTTPIFICFNNDVVLTKELSNYSSSTNTALVNKAFPNLDIKDFYWELIQRQDHTIVSIARKESIDSILGNFKELQIHPFQIALGITSLTHITSYINEENINLLKYTVGLKEQQLVKLSTNENPIEQFYEINGLKISNYNLLGFSQILGYLNKNDRFTNLTDSNFNFENIIKNERIFQITGKIALTFFGLLLLLNFLGYNHYFTTVNELNTTLMASNSQKDKLMALENLVKKKQDRVDIISNATNSRTTYYLDVLGESVPKSILLESMGYQPLSKRIQIKKPILLEKKVIIISGISKDIDEFSEWVEKLGNLSWITSVETLDFDYVNENTSDFLIEIKVNDK